MFKIVSLNFLSVRLENEEFGDEDTTISTTPTSFLWQSFARWRLTKTSTKTKRVHRYASLFGTVIVYSLALWGLVSILQRAFEAYSHRHYHEVFPTYNLQLEGCDCGKSVAEAVSLGCKFDALSMAWLPEHCRDDELTAEFDTTGKGKSC